MNWKGHLKWGLVTTTILTILLILMAFMQWVDFIDWHFMLGESEFEVIYAIPLLPIAFLMGLYGSLFPDVDIRTSKAFAVTYVILIALSLYYAITDYLLGLLTSLFIMIFIIGLKHRGFMHKWITGLMLGFLFIWLFGGYIIGLYFTIGFWTHLICDRKKKTGEKKNVR